MKTTRFLTLFAATAVAATIAACGGSDGEGPVPEDVASEPEDVTSDIPEGRWKGTVAGNPGVLVVLEDGETWGMSEYGALHGWTTGEGNGKFSGGALDFEFSGGIYDVSYTGSFIEKGELKATVNSGSGTQEIFGGYDSLYDDPPIPLMDLAGRYDGYGVTSLTGGGVAVVEIATNGVITMAPNGGCAATGLIAPRSTGKNIFDISITFKQGATCLLDKDITVSGIGLADGEFLKAMAIDSTGYYGFVYSAEKTSY